MLPAAAASCCAAVGLSARQRAMSRAGNSCAAGHLSSLEVRSSSSGDRLVLLLLVPLAAAAADRLPNSWSKAPGGHNTPQ